MLRTDVPGELAWRGIEPPRFTMGFGITLDVAEPWGGGRFEGRVERRRGRSTEPVTVALRCDEAWLDVPPQVVGQKPLRSLSTWFEIRSRAVPIWLEERLWEEQQELGALDGVNWHHFSFVAPAHLPRALEGTFAAFRWQIVATRPRRLGHAEALLPLLLVEPHTQPVVRVEETPLGSWRLLAWRAEDDADAAGTLCSMRFEPRRPEDAPLPGEGPVEEQRRLGTYREGLPPAS